MALQALKCMHGGGFRGSNTMIYPVVLAAETLGIFLSQIIIDMPSQKGSTQTDMPSTLVFTALP